MDSGCPPTGEIQEALYRSTYTVTLYVYKRNMNVHLWKLTDTEVINFSSLTNLQYCSQAT